MAKTAAMKSKLYSIYAKEIYQVAKTGGTDPNGNLALRSLIEKAKKEHKIPTVVKDFFIFYWFQLLLSRETKQIVTKNFGMILFFMLFNVLVI